MNFPTGNLPCSVIFDDFNFDGKPDLAVVNQSSDNVAVLLNTCPESDKPTISPLPNRLAQKGSPASNTVIANVADLEDPAHTLKVTVNGAASATVNGITISNISVSLAGVVTADVIASCQAQASASFTLRVTDSHDQFSEAFLLVNATPNTPPELVYDATHHVIVGGGTTITPLGGPMDNGAISSVVVQNKAAFTGAVSVSATGVVSISNAQPVGSHTITIRTTDNCGTQIDAPLTLVVDRISSIIADPPICYGPGVSATVTASVRNESASPQTGVFTASLSPGLAALDGTCTASVGTCIVTGPSTITWEGILNAGQTVTLQYLVQIGDQVVNGTKLCLSSSASVGGMPSGTVQSCLITNCSMCRNVSFAPKSDLATRPQPRPVLADINNDGKLDLVLVYQSAGSVSVLLGNGNGGFGAEINTPVGVQPNSIAVADFNLDGKPDIAMASSSGALIMLGNGTGGFGAVSNTGMGNGFTNIVQADFNLDGKPDLAVLSLALDSVLVGLGDGMGGIGPPTPFQVLEFPSGLAIGDFNHDGKPDLVVSTASAGSTIRLLLGNGLGAFNEIPISSSDPAYAVVVGDVNLDGKLDLIVSYTDHVSVLLGNGLGGFHIAYRVIDTTPGGVLLTDINLDGKPDLIVARNNGHDVSFQLGFGPGTFGPPTSLVMAENSLSFAVGDLNLDGKPDLVLGNLVPDAVSLFLNSCAANSAPGITPVNVTQPQGVTASRSIANVHDVEDPENTLSVTINGSASATINGLTISNLSVSAAGEVTADIDASCTATDATFTLRVIDRGLLFTEATLNVTVTANPGCGSVGPGVLPSAASPSSDQKPGSVLVYNIYTSNATAPNLQNTRWNLTNVSPHLPALVHLFLVEGTSCSVADLFVCLTPNQTLTILASDFDPGATGYLIAVSVDATGCPSNFNNLIGDEYVRFASGHAANLGAEAISTLPGRLPSCSGSSSTALLRFDGVSYNQLPRVLALDNIASRADGNEMLLILNSIGGDLSTSAVALGATFGSLYDDTEQSHSFILPAAGCQVRSMLGENFPRTTPRFDSVIPAGRSGWMKLWGSPDVGVFGAAINFNPRAHQTGTAFNQGHNLHKLRLTNEASITIPVFPPRC